MAFEPNDNENTPKNVTFSDILGESGGTSRDEKPIKLEKLDTFQLKRRKLVHARNGKLDPNHPEHKLFHTNVVPETQADKIFRKFGGAPNLAKILGLIGRPRALTSLYKWNYRGGHIPPKAWADIFVAARYEGIIISAADIDPRESIIRQSLDELKKYPRRVLRNRRKLNVV